MSLRWIVYVDSKPPKGALKRKVCPKFVLGTLYRNTLGTRLLFPSFAKNCRPFCSGCHSLICAPVAQWWSVTMWWLLQTDFIDIVRWSRSSRAIMPPKCWFLVWSILYFTLWREGVRVSNIMLCISRCFHYTTSALECCSITSACQLVAPRRLGQLTLWACDPSCNLRGQCVEQLLFLLFI